MCLKMVIEEHKLLPPPLGCSNHSVHCSEHDHSRGDCVPSFPSMDSCMRTPVSGSTGFLNTRVESAPVACTRSATGWAKTGKDQLVQHTVSGFHLGNILNFTGQFFFLSLFYLLIFLNSNDPFSKHIYDP